MDEPLSNLDAKLRVQIENRDHQLHLKLNTTFIYVTHDRTKLDHGYPYRDYEGRLRSADRQPAEAL
jgi:ABC-type lipoprotein export system ATPase subunit